MTFFGLPFLCNAHCITSICIFSLEPLKAYQGEDIEIQLPRSLTMHSIDWLAVWCVQYTHNFGHVNVPDDLDVPPALGQTKLTVSSRLGGGGGGQGSGGKPATVGPSKKPRRHQTWSPPPPPPPPLPQLTDGMPKWPGRVSAREY